MEVSRSWGDDMITPEVGNDVDNSVALEALIPDDINNHLVQGKMMSILPPFFNPINITIENGVYYVTLYVCCVEDDIQLTQRLAIWLSSLKDTDVIKLSVSMLVADIPFHCLITTMGAFANTKARIEIFLDQIVLDGLAYFYLLADKIIAMNAGALFVPSYIAQRKEDTSVPHRAVHDFYQWVVEDAVTSGRLTPDEAAMLNSGKHVVIPTDRFA